MGNFAERLKDLLEKHGRDFKIAQAQTFDLESVFDALPVQTIATQHHHETCWFVCPHRSVFNIEIARKSTGLKNLTILAEADAGPPHLTNGIVYIEEALLDASRWAFEIAPGQFLIVRFSEFSMLVKCRISHFAMIPQWQELLAEVSMGV